MLDLNPKLNVIKFISDLWQVGGFLKLLRFPKTNKADCHDMTEILLKVALNTKTLTKKQTPIYQCCTLSC